MDIGTMTPDKECDFAVTLPVMQWQHRGAKCEFHVFALESPCTDKVD